MKRTMAPVLMLGSVLMLLSACWRDTGPLETAYELTGDPGVSLQPVVTVPMQGSAPRTATREAVTLPWREMNVVDRGETVLEATPSRGALTCRIVVEGKEVAKVTGAVGEKVTCRGKVDE